MWHVEKYSYASSFFNSLCLQATQYLFISVQLAVRKRNKGIQLIFLLIMEVQQGMTPEQASAWQWHPFLLAVNNSAQLTVTLPNHQKEFFFHSILLLPGHNHSIDVPLKSSRFPLSRNLFDMPVVPFPTWLGMAGPPRQRPARKFWIPGAKSTSFSTRNEPQSRPNKGAWC